MDVQVEQVIDRPREEVARYAMAPENEPVWIGGIRQSRMLSEPPVRVGTEVERIASFLGKRIEYALRVVEHEPGKRIVMDSIRGPFAMRVTYAFADEPAGGTRVTNRVEGETGGFYGLAAPLMAGAVKRSLQRDLRTLKRIVESSAAGGAGRQ